MRWLVAVKIDQAYKKIVQILGEHNEVLQNVSVFKELNETIIGDDIDFAIIEHSIHWRNRAEALFSEHRIPYIVFTGEFKDLETKIKEHGFSNKPMVIEETQTNAQVAAAEEVESEITVGGQKPPAAPIYTPDSVSSKEERSTAAAPPTIIYRDREVPKYIDRPVEVEKYIEVPTYIDRPVEVKVEVPVEVIVEVPVEVEKLINVPYLKTMPKQLIVIGSLYSGAGSSFASIALAKVLNSLRVDTCVIEHPINEPYFYITLDGSMRLPRDYSYIFPQVLEGVDIKKRSQEWQDEYITWMPSDPATGKLTNWTSEHMAKCLYGIKNAVTILDISTSWLEPGLKEILLQADHVLLVAGPEPARLLSSEAKSIKSFIRRELEDKVQVIANQVPEGRGGKTREWLESLPADVISRIPGLLSSDMVHASWEGKTVFDDDPELVLKFTECFFSLLRQIIPREYLVQRSSSKGVMSWIKKAARGRAH